MNILDVKELYKRFPQKRNWWGAVQEEAFTAVDHISFHIKEAENVGLLGPNGAGKTTTIQMLLSTLTPTSGDIRYFGRSFKDERAAILRSVGFASTYVQLPGRLTVTENITFYARLYGISRAVCVGRVKEYLNHFGIWHLRDKETGLLSAGEKTRVMLAKAFIATPRIVLLDEPTAALDPDIAQEVRNFVMMQQKEHGVSFLFTSHNMSEVTEVCDRVLVMQRGKIIANNTPSQLAATVSRIRVVLLVTEGLDRLTQYLNAENMVHSVMDKRAEIELQEDSIAELLQKLAHLGVRYAEIGIKKPQLEDYFLHVSKQQRASQK